MIKSMLRDAEQLPRLFFWNSPIPRETLFKWLAERGLSGLPEDLIEFWSETGGGELFDSETLLGPFGDPHLGDDLDSVNPDFREGRTNPYLIFHTGCCLSAIRLSDGKYVQLDPVTYEEREEYEDLEMWYKKVIRDEYGESYGLSP